MKVVPMKIFNKIWETKFHNKATCERQHSVGMRKMANAIFPFLIHFYLVVSFPYSPCTLVIIKDKSGRCKFIIKATANTEFYVHSLACSTPLPFIKHYGLVLAPEQNWLSFALTVSSSSRYQLTNTFSFNEKQVL